MLCRRSIISHYANEIFRIPFSFLNNVDQVPLRILSNRGRDNVNFISFDARYRCRLEGERSVRHGTA